MVNQAMVEGFLKELVDGKSGGGGKSQRITIYLVNGIKLQGEILEYDDVAIKLTTQQGQKPQLVFRSAISTILPDGK